MKRNESVRRLKVRQPEGLSQREPQWRDFKARDKRWRHVTSHTFRKTVATALSCEFDSLTASAQLGHSSTTITEKYYIARRWS